MKLVVGNFKMNLLKEDIDTYLDVLNGKHFNNAVFCPSFIYLNDFIRHGYVVGSQDVSFKDMGAYTGDVSIKQLKSLGVTYSIIGHSERREYHNDDSLVNSKLKLCLDNGITPILCIGETKDDYEKGITEQVLKKELDDAFLSIDDLSNIIVAYEPIWAIGTGIVPTNDVIYKVIKFIKEYIYDKRKIRLNVLYGGSVSNKNIKELESITNIDGYLVGGCSTKPNDFLELITTINKN